MFKVGDKIIRTIGGYGGYLSINTGEVYTFHSYIDENKKYLRINEIYLKNPYVCDLSSFWEIVKEETPKQPIFKVGDKVRRIAGVEYTMPIGCEVIISEIGTSNDECHSLKFVGWENSSWWYAENFELVKEPIMKHKHAELIKAWADGADIQFYNYANGWTDQISPAWLDNVEYRIKPEPKLDVVKYAFADIRSTGGYANSRDNDNLKLTFDAETGKLKAAEVIHAKE